MLKRSPRSLQFIESRPAEGNLRQRNPTDLDLLFCNLRASHPQIESDRRILSQHPRDQTVEARGEQSFRQLSEEKFPGALLLLCLQQIDGIGSAL
jgi:hypothetical protein